MKKIALWIFRMILKGIFGKMQDARVVKAERKRDAAVMRTESTEKSMQLEKDMLRKRQEQDKIFEKQVESRPADDPFGADKWNAGT